MSTNKFSSRVHCLLSLCFIKPHSILRQMSSSIPKHLFLNNNHNNSLSQLYNKLKLNQNQQYTLPHWYLSIFHAYDARLFDPILVTKFQKKYLHPHPKVTDQVQVILLSSTFCCLETDGVAVVTFPRVVGGLDPSKVCTVKVKAIYSTYCFTSHIHNL